LTEDWQNAGFGLYIHWPFCMAKCPYCDFNSHVSTTIDQTQWEIAYFSELERVSMQTQGRSLSTIFFGGGTPSLMDVSLVERILYKIKSLWSISNDIEITLEANPTSVEAGRFQGYREAGVDRVSMGIQALDDDSLRKLGRLHSVKEGLSAFDIARGIFDRTSFDLIYARQDQSVKSWKAELKQALNLGLDHLSLYQLTIEQGTAFGDRYNKGKLAGLPDDDSSADMYFATQELCSAAGLPSYEVSNHSRPGEESRHNLIYWRYGDYVGIGPGAHGRLTLDGQKWATETHLAPQKWLTAVSESGTGEKPMQRVDHDAQASEFLLMGLRLSEGVSLQRYADIARQDLDRDRVTYLADLGYVVVDQGQLIVTPNGRPILNAVLRELLGA